MKKQETRKDGKKWKNIWNGDIAWLPQCLSRKDTILSHKQQAYLDTGKLLFGLTNSVWKLMIQSFCTPLETRQPKTQRPEGRRETLEWVRGRDTWGRTVTLFERKCPGCFVWHFKLAVSPINRLSDQVASPLSAINCLQARAAIYYAHLGILGLFA